MRILFFDPGYTTGWAQFVKGAPGERYTSGQIEGPEKVWDHLGSLQMVYTHTDPRMQDDLLIGYESFQYRNALSKANLTPVEVIGVIKEWARQHNIPLEPQTPAEAVGPKAFFTDERLAKLGLLKVPKSKWPHANDAMRHLLVYLSFGKGVRLDENIIQGLRREES